MKMSKTTGLGFILVLLVCFTVICACEEKAGNSSGNGDYGIKSLEEIPGEGDVKDGTFPGLDAETERRIKLDYLNIYLDPEALSVENVHFDFYFGNHSGYEIIVVLGDAAVMSAITIAGYTFTFGSGGIRMLAWRQGENSGSGRFYEVQEAYDLGLLTVTNIKNIHRMYYANLTDDEYADFIK
jgi:hypothetical protein